MYVNFAHNCSTVDNIFTIDRCAFINISSDIIAASDYIFSLSFVCYVCSIFIKAHALILYKGQ